MEIILKISKKHVTYGVIGLSVLVIVLILIGIGIPPFDMELQHYKGQSGYTIDERYTWDDFGDLNDVFTQVSKDRLREEADVVYSLLGHCRIFIDRHAKVIWVSGCGPDPLIRYVYWWTP